MDFDIKKEVQTKNETFKERFQFVLWVNENVVCQRYFKVLGYNNESLQSVELLDMLNECVDMIKEDLKYKSWLYQFIIGDGPVKLTGFSKAPEKLKYEDLILLFDKETKELEDYDGTIIEKTYVSYPKDEEDAYGEHEKLSPYDVTFKFELKVDERTVYQHIWDGTVYNRAVRNGVDLSNQGPLCDMEKVNMNSSESLSRYLKCGRVDLIYTMIKKICSVMSSSQDNPNKYTKAMEYHNDETDSDVEYYCSTYNRNFVKGYQKWMQAKTNKYFKNLY